MRASATSRTASPASYQAPQAKSDANKADDSSPFALLVDAVAPKDATKDAGKPPMKDASGSHDRADDAGTDQNGQAADAQSSQPAAVAQPTQPGKSGKTDKTKDEASAKADSEAAQAAPDAAAVLAQPPQQPGAQNQPLPTTVLPAQPPVAAEQDDDLPVDAATASAGAQPKPVADAKPAETTPQPAFAPDLSGITPGPKFGATSGAPSNGRTGTPSKAQSTAPAPAKMPPAAQTAAADPNSDADAEETVEIVPAADSQIAAPASPSTTPGTSKIADAVQAWRAGSGNESDSSTVQARAPQPADAKPNASETGQSDAPPGTGAKPADPTAADDAKTNLVKGGTLKTRTIQAADKGAGDKSDAAAADAAKAQAAQPEVQTLATAPKPTAQPAPGGITGIDSAASPQTLSTPAPANNVSQHIQVSAQASPDLPALAVEIAAKSQSGARQFDIRLDPPELGRVEVRLSIDATGKASAHLSADQPQTLSLLQKDASVLTRALRDAGLDVSQNGLNFSLRQQGENSSGNAGTNGRRSARSFPLSATLSIDTTQASTAYRGPANGRLDIRV